jgi:DNA-binding CsgD family transcriptional regulator
VSRPPELATRLEALGGDLYGSLQQHPVPMYVLDRAGTILWTNDVANELIPGAADRPFGDVVVPEAALRTRRHFALRMLGREAFVDHRVVLRGSGGARREVEISSAPLREGGRIVGVFGVIRPGPPRVVAALPERRAADPPSLTPRQGEILLLLAAGRTTAQMAELLGLSTETIRNHVRAVLAQLGARSRLEAVLVAHRDGMLELPQQPAGD